MNNKLLDYFAEEKDKNIEHISPDAKEKVAILCLHCKRTKTNGISCIGACVADNDY